MPATAACFVLGTCLACVPTEPIPPSEGRLQVEGILNVGTSSQVVTVSRVGAELGPNGQPVSGAVVSITTSDGLEMVATESSPAGRYSVDPSAYGATISPGGSYTLRIVIPGRPEVTGVTTVPLGAPQPLDPVITPFSRSSDTLRASWPRVVGARSYYVAVSSKLSYAPGYTELRYRAFADTAVTLHGTIEVFDGDPVFTPFDTVTVVAGAVDDNFYTYYHTSSDPFAGAPPMRLQGALGVFGSFVPLYQRRLEVVE